MLVGKVKFYNSSEGYGCIVNIDGREVYFHYTALSERGIDRDLSPGYSVAYDLIETRMGPEASNVRRAAPY